MLLFRPPRGGLIPRRRLEELLAQFNNGEWVTLVESSLEHALNGITTTARKRGRSKNDMECITAKAFHLTQVGELSSARHVLESSLVAQGNEATENSDRRGRRPSKPRSELDPGITDLEPELPFDLDVDKFLHNLRPGKGVLEALQGWRPNIWKWGWRAQSFVASWVRWHVSLHVQGCPQKWFRWFVLGGSQRHRSQMVGCEASLSISATSQRERPTHSNVPNPPGHGPSVWHTPSKHQPVRTLKPPLCQWMALVRVTSSRETPSFKACGTWWTGTRWSHSSVNSTVHHPRSCGTMILARFTTITKERVGNRDHQCRCSSALVNTERWLPCSRSCSRVGNSSHSWTTCVSADQPECKRCSSCWKLRKPRKHQHPFGLECRWHWTHRGSRSICSCADAWSTSGGVARRPRIPHSPARP